MEIPLQKDRTNLYSFLITLINLITNLIIKNFLQIITYHSMHKSLHIIIKIPI